MAIQGNPSASGLARRFCRLQLRVQARGRAMHRTGQALERRSNFVFLSGQAAGLKLHMWSQAQEPIQLAPITGYHCSKNKTKKSSEPRPPSLDISVACPLLTPAASVFPTAASDYYRLDELLTKEEKDLRVKIRQFMEKEAAPVVSKYWETADFPFHLIPKLGSLGIAGGIIKGHGCPGLSAVAYAMCVSEMARVDTSIASFCLVQSCLAMLSIGMCQS
ncbi:hypothetical protein PR202_ga16213 [Eleusine coracana subsp. coracana]|uniref:Acyl-CoA dehydrogenase/oxidase N-terminal domain-containing protein n=1 Tax=Eleusine coracana subsp. coracana TaxID=191504 RepID=A0AAV5CMA8_ELECO|nr:hypothetical protein PR202_ga16213 [Eleusine coracana subsp. coracana]